MNKNSRLQRYLIEKTLKIMVNLPSRQGLSAPVLRKLLNTACTVFPVDHRLNVQTLELAGLSCEEIHAQDNSATRSIFHIHGGAFFLGGLTSHRGLMCDLANATKAQIIHADYPLAPEKPFPHALNALYNAYLALLAQGIDPKNLILSGDSCGGNLALALCLKLRDEKQPLPSALILMSPWLDLSLSGESIQLNAKHDALLSEPVLRQGVQYYIDEDTSIDEAYVSPLFANLAGLPDILIQVGSKEILLDDAKRLKQLADHANIDCTLSIFPGMWHNFHLFNHWVDSAQNALIDIARFIDRVDH